MKRGKFGILMILNDLNGSDIAGRGRKRGEEERGKRKEGRGGRSDDEEEATRRVKKRKSF